MPVAVLAGFVIASVVFVVFAVLFEPYVIANAAGARLAATIAASTMVVANVIQRRDFAFPDRFRLGRYVICCLILVLPRRRSSESATPRGRNGASSGKAQHNAKQPIPVPPSAAIWCQRVGRPVGRVTVSSILTYP
jgi:hypothetical protein